MENKQNSKINVLRINSLLFDNIDALEIFVICSVSCVAFVCQFQLGDGNRLFFAATLRVYNGWVRIVADVLGAFFARSGGKTAVRSEIIGELCATLLPSHSPSHCFFQGVSMALERSGTVFVNVEAGLDTVLSIG